MSASLARVERAAQRATLAHTATPDLDATSNGLVLPNIADFVLDERYLGVAKIYPRQLLILKLITGQVDLLTDYDRGVLDKWTSGFTISDDGTRFEGGYGTTPDLLDRIAAITTDGRSHFREAVMVLGRRAGKNWMGSNIAAYQVWRLLCTGDPQAHFGIDANMTLTLSVFAGQHQQALSGQFQNIADLIRSRPCFAPYVAEDKSGVLRLYTPAQLARGGRDAGESGLLEIVARESTQHGARGPSAFGLMFDEMAHATNSGPNRGADELFPAAVPSLLQCSPDEFIYESSSPASKHGAFYENYCRALSLDDGRAAYPEMVVFQLPSWDVYEDFALTQEGLEAYPGGPLLPRIDSARGH